MVIQNKLLACHQIVTITRRSFFILLFLCFSVVASSYAEDEAKLILGNLEIHQSCIGDLASEAGMICRVVVKGVPAVTVKDFFLDNPPREIVDVEKLKIPIGKVFKQPTNPLVQAIRAGVHPSGTRFVFDLAPELLTTRRVTIEKGELLVEINGKKGERPAVPPLQPVGTTAIDVISAQEKKPILPPPSPTATLVPSITPTPTFAPLVEEKEVGESTPTPTPTPTNTPIATMTLAPQTPTLAYTATPRATATFYPTPTSTFVPILTATPEPTELAAAEEKSKEDSLSLEMPADTLARQATLKFSIDKVLVQFMGNARPVQNLVVKNTSKKTLYMTVRPQLILDPGLATEKYQPTNEILASPRNFDLQPGDQRTVRLVATRPVSDREQAYLVSFSPQADPFDKTIEVKLGGKKSTLNVVTAMGVLVLLAPKKPHPTMDIQRTEEGLIAVNTGNISVLLADGKACSDKDMKGCRDITPKRLYPGNRWTVKAPVDTRFSFVKKVGDDFEAVAIPPFVE